MMALEAGERNSANPVFRTSAPRLCSCGKPIGPDGECAACRARRESAESFSFSNGAPRGHAFAGLALFNGDEKEKPKGKGKEPKAETKPAAKARCSPTWYGSTDPELTPDGRYTGKLVVTYNDAAIKSPCVKECVRKHEQVHVRDLGPLMKRIGDCDRAAGGDWDKLGQCNLMALEIYKLVDRTECNAYAVSIDCLKTMLADPRGKCGKAPHRKEVEAHLKREECHLAESCAAAKPRKP
jgi:hypothetical protein